MGCLFFLPRHPPCCSPAAVPKRSAEETSATSNELRNLYTAGKRKVISKHHLTNNGWCFVSCSILKLIKPVE